MWLFRFSDVARFIINIYCYLPTMFKWDGMVPSTLFMEEFTSIDYH